MTPLSLVLISIGLAMDSFTVAICGGLQMSKVRLILAARMAFMFGFFQAAMPVMGWLGGNQLLGFIQAWDHWVAFGLLAIIGGKMIWEALRSDAECQVIDPGDWRLLFVLSIATSIDALAVGLSFSVLQQPILLPAILIGTITFGMSLVGVYLGQRFGGMIQQHAQTVGGLILLFIGTRILIDHLDLVSIFRAAIA